MNHEKVPTKNRGAECKDPLKVIAWQRRADVLTRPKLPCLAEFHTVNLTAGCPNQCRYCYAQSYAHHPGWGKVAFYANARDRLKNELARWNMNRQRRPQTGEERAASPSAEPFPEGAGEPRGPRLVYFSTASEPFVPAPRVLDDLYEIMAALLDAGAALVISTKGVVPERFVALFARYPGKVCVQVGITTLDDDARRLIEPRAALVTERLDNLARLIGNSGTGSGTQRSEHFACPRNSIEARIDPLVPGLTDTDANLSALLSELARVGVREAVLSYLFLRWGIKFPNDLALGGWSSRAMRTLYTHKVTNYCGGGTIYLPPTDYRAERFAAIAALASTHGIAVKICRCKNGDIPEAVCCHPTDLLVATGAVPAEGVGAGEVAEPTESPQARQRTEPNRSSAHPGALPEPPPPAGRQLTLL